MMVDDEREVLRSLRRKRGDDVDDLGGESREEFLERNFEDPENSDILIEKQTKERKRKK